MKTEIVKATGEDGSKYTSFSILDGEKILLEGHIKVLPNQVSGTRTDFSDLITNYHKLKKELNTIIDSI